MNSYYSGNVIGGSYYPDSMYSPQSYMQNNITYPQNQNALTPEQIQKLRGSKASNGLLDLTISEEDHLRSLCCHSENGHSVVQQINDGSGDVYCPICGERWNLSEYNRKEVEVICNKIIDMMQCVKWMGEIPVNLVKDYFTMIPMIRKFPDIYEYASKNMNRMFNQYPFQSYNDTSLNSQYNSLFNPAVNGGFGYNNYGQPINNYYNQSNMYNPNPNPMQITQQPMYSNNYPYQQQPMQPQPNYYQQPNPNPYGQTVPQQQPVFTPPTNTPISQPQYTPQFATPQVQQPVQQQQSVQQPAQSQTQAQTLTKFEL